MTGFDSYARVLERRLRDPDRLAAIERLDLLGDGPIEAFDRATRTATERLGAPVALVSIVVDDRQIFRSHAGLPEPWASRPEAPLDVSFCQHVVATGAELVVADAATHELADDVAAARAVGVVAYLGVPLWDADGHVLGSFCAIRPQAHEWSPEELAILREVAEEVHAHLAERGRAEGAAAAGAGVSP